MRIAIAIMIVIISGTMCRYMDIYMKVDDRQLYWLIGCFTGFIYTAVAIGGHRCK